MTPRYPPAHATARKTTTLYGSCTIDLANVHDRAFSVLGGYKKVHWELVHPATGVSQRLMNLPECTLLSLYAWVETGNTKTYLYDDCVEVLTRPVLTNTEVIPADVDVDISKEWYMIYAMPRVPDAVCAAWIWGDGFVESNASGKYTPNNTQLDAYKYRFVQSLTGAPAFWEVLVRSGMIAGKSAVDQSVTVYFVAQLGVSTYPADGEAQICDECSMPPFNAQRNVPMWMATPGCIFSEHPNVAYPAPQPAVGQRNWRSAVWEITLPANSPADAAVLDLNGGPWIYDYTASPAGAAIPDSHIKSVTLDSSTFPGVSAMTTPLARLPQLDSQTTTPVAVRLPYVGGIERIALEIFNTDEENTRSVVVQVKTQSP